MRAHGAPADTKMTVSEIAEVAVPLAEVKGKTPKQQVYSLLYTENRKADGLVERVDKGTFKLRPRRAKVKA